MKFLQIKTYYNKYSKKLNHIKREEINKNISQKHIFLRICLKILYIQISITKWSTSKYCRLFNVFMTDYIQGCATRQVIGSKIDSKKCLENLYRFSWHHLRLPTLSYPIPKGLRVLSKNVQTHRVLNFIFRRRTLLIYSFLFDIYILKTFNFFFF